MRHELDAASALACHLRRKIHQAAKEGICLAVTGIGVVAVLVSVAGAAEMQMTCDLNLWRSWKERLAS